MSLVEKFQSRLRNLSGDSLAKYRRSLSALDIFLHGHSMNMSDLSARVVGDWVYDMMRSGKPKTAIVRNLNVLSSVLRGETAPNLVETAKRARELSRMFGASSIEVPQLAKEKSFNACLSLLQSWIKGNPIPDATHDIIIVSLLGGCIPVEELIMLRKGSISAFSGTSRELLLRNRSNTRDYVFDLRQSYQSPRQIIKAMAADLSGTFESIIGKDELDIDRLISSIWVALAIRCGATASEALGCVTVPAGYMTTGFVTVSRQSDEAKSRWIKAVATLLTQNTSHWYALHMRRGVTFEELQKDIAANLRPAPTLFYPCQQISRNIRNRKVLADQPFITGTVFFRTAPEAVMPMFEKIGDKAWCYRMTCTPGSPYAIIPTHEMQRFQSAIGQFTPDTEIHPIGELDIRPSDRVILLMADFYNREGTVDKILTDHEGRTIYRVAFTNAYGIEWTVDADTRQLSRISQV